MCTSKMTVAGEALRKELEEKGMQLADTLVNGMENMELGVLIGGDYYWQMVTGKIDRLRGLVAIESIFGWLIQGSVSEMIVVAEVHEVGVMQVVTRDDSQLSDQLRLFWEVEALGILPVAEKKMTSEEEEALQFFQETVKDIGGRYEVRLPWCENKKQLTSNLTIAENRLNNLLKKSSK